MLTYYKLFIFFDNMHPIINNISPIIISFIVLLIVSVFRYIINSVDNVNAFIIIINIIGCFFDMYIINFVIKIIPIIIPIKNGINILMLDIGFDNMFIIISYFFKTINMAVPLIPGIMVDIASIIPNNIFVKKVSFNVMFNDSLFINIISVNKIVNIIILGIFFVLNSLMLKSIEPIIKPIKSNKIGK